MQAADRRPSLVSVVAERGRSGSARTGPPLKHRSAFPCEVCSSRYSTVPVGGAPKRPARRKHRRFELASGREFEIVLRDNGPLPGFFHGIQGCPQPPAYRTMRALYGYPSHHPHPPRPGQRHPRALHGRRPARQLGTPGRAHGHGRHRRSALARRAQAQPRQPELVEPRPLRALERPRFDAAVFAAAPHRLPADDRGAPEFPPARLAHRGPPGARARDRHRDHHRPARARVSRTPWAWRSRRSC